jgi:hypothetical protein
MYCVGKKKSSGKMIGMSISYGWKTVNCHVCCCGINPLTSEARDILTVDDRADQKA